MMPGHLTSVASVARSVVRAVRRCSSPVSGDRHPKPGVATTREERMKDAVDDRWPTQIVKGHKISTGIEPAGPGFFDCNDQGRVT
jgi:hypothetical protein